MSNYVLLKRKSNLLLLKIPEKFCADYEILKIEDEVTLNELILREQKLNPELVFSMVQLDLEDKESETTQKTRVVSLKQGDYYMVYKQEELVCIEAFGSYSNITILNQKAITITFCLSDIESKLSEDIFIRVHRSVIININYVTKFIGNTIYIGEKSFPIGRKFKKALINRLNLVCGSKKMISDEYFEN